MTIISSLVINEIRLFTCGHQKSKRSDKSAIKLAIDDVILSAHAHFA
jgi:hypothetical protein